MKDNIILKKNTRTISLIFIISSLIIYSLEFFVPRIVNLLIDSIKNFNIYMSIGLVFLLVSVRISSNLGNSISIALVKKRCNEIIKESNIILIKNISFSKNNFSLDLANKKKRSPVYYRSIGRFKKPTARTVNINRKVSSYYCHHICDIRGQL